MYVLHKIIYVQMFVKISALVLLKDGTFRYLFLDLNISILGWEKG